ncbi:MAG: CDP-diacylglycerol--serine O-phosphatidyltransferase [Syntrophales bacterium]|jgi:CDP-diacylglycerol--serine O-phosphatidyltransferase|nr:CDP-diacylglycerol--serine O-phosphatidyltransferase [Syntrophales bacterium]NLN59439.1 CDP-diacylglycerol--serine O-phosphatidyltransferase [Deltaproteobacteria bacterium]
MNDGTTSKRQKIRKGVYILPNLFTTANLLCGFYSIILAMEGDFFLAAIPVLIAFVLDGLDGRIARMTNTTTKFGAEYDSLSDLVTFGVAPAVLVYVWGLTPFGKWGWLAASLFVICGALRLARFNIQIGIVDSKTFNGLPIPAAAAVVATTILLYYKLGGTGAYHNVFILFGVFAIAILMVSNIQYYSFKDLNFFAKKPFMSFLLIVCILYIFIAETEIMIFTFALGYALSGPSWFLFKLVNKYFSQARLKHSYNLKQNK